MSKANKKVKKKAIKNKKKSAKSVFDSQKALERYKEAERNREKVAEPKITTHPTAGPKITEFEDLLDRQLAGDTGPPKSKRGPGRPPKEPEPEPPELTIDIVAGVVRIPFELWAIGQDVKSLALSDEEAKQMAGPAIQLLEYYLPKIPVIAYAWVSMSVSIFWVMRTRLLLIQEIKKQRQKQQSVKPSEPAQPGVNTKFPTEIKQEKV